MTGAVLVVSGTGTGVGLGTLNHSALTPEALDARKLARAGVVIGSWPRQPGIAELANLTDLQAVADGPLGGIMPAGAGGLDRPLRSSPPRRPDSPSASAAAARHAPH